MPPTLGRPLILYLSVQAGSMGAMLAQNNEDGIEQAIYYLSKKFNECETRYLAIERTCCALAWATKKLRQYLLYYSTLLVSRLDPLSYIFESPHISLRMSKWQMLLSEFDLHFTTLHSFFHLQTCVQCCHILTASWSYASPILSLIQINDVTERQI